MIPASFEFTRPETLAEALALLGKNPDAKILAGGHSLIPMMRFRLATPSMLIDLNQVGSLSHIQENGEYLRIGAMTREAVVERSDVVKKRYPLLFDTARVVADPIVRNLATIGGNLAHADPANDHPATVLAYKAQLVATGPRGERIITASDFFQDAFTTALAGDEILTEIRIPKPSGRSGGAYFKLERKVGDYATAAVAAQIALDGSGRVVSAGIGLTNVGLTPIQATAAEESLKGKPLDDRAVKEAAKLASEAAEPIEDHRGSEEYKRHLVRTLTNRALNKAKQRAEGGGAA
ncbi:MAG TPA: xanthine dehydrogenase family protein subunit M [Vicinamibacteria bacterium]|nr:xanthine dehydrogenase family protein subunit M [Vicinamibacteria bacterium]